jgi:gluconokinase
MSTETRPANAPSPAPAMMIVMGVSGCGKSTIRALLASRLQWKFEDADWFHPASNVDKMHSGIPFTDEDRWPWLDAAAAWIDKTRRSDGHDVITCSARKRRYRNILIGKRADVRLVYLKGDSMSISCREVCCTASSKRSKSQGQTRIRSPSQSSRNLARSSHGFCQR